jgi:hypothetical protein
MLRVSRNQRAPWAAGEKSGRSGKAGARTAVVRQSPFPSLSIPRLNLAGISVTHCFEKWIRSLAGLQYDYGSTDCALQSGIGRDAGGIDLEAVSSASHYGGAGMNLICRKNNNYDLFSAVSASTKVGPGSRCTVHRTEQLES